jgi:arylsulfatase A-like enzyme
MKSLLLFVLLAHIALVASAADKPNIIYILVDDMGYGDAGCYGQKTLTTPNIDRLASEGMKFTRHYAGCTVCAPSRCVLMTGLHTGHSRVRGNGPGTIPDTDLTVPKLLKNAGYNTACIGKYGLGLPMPTDDPAKKGFEYFFGYVDTRHAHNCYTTFLTRNGERVPLRNTLIYGNDDLVAKGIGVAELKGREDFAPQLLADDVQKYLDQHAKSPKPFFLYYALNLPHANNEAGRKSSPLGHGLESPSYGEFANKDWPDVEKGFASVMRFVDNEVGAVMAKVKALGIEENTLIFFASDNGPHAEGLHDSNFFESNGALKGIKRELTDGGIRIPFIAHWPGKIKAGSVSDHVSGFQDLMPTVSELAHMKAGEEYDGISLVPTLLGKGKQREHPYLFWNFDEQGGKRAVLKWPWKLIHVNTESAPQKKNGGVVPPKPLVVQLYNLDQDPAEEKNVAAENAALVAELEKDMTEAYRQPRGN